MEKRETFPLLIFGLLTLIIQTMMTKTCHHIHKHIEGSTLL